MTAHQNIVWSWFLVWSTAVLVVGFLQPAVAEDDQKPNETDQQSEVQKLIDEAKYQEIYGREDLRNQLLEKAEKLAGGKNAAIQSMKGKVNDGVDWRTPLEIAKQTLADKKHQKYLAVRDAAADNFQGQLQLANWCRQNGMLKQWRGHLNRAAWHDPNNVQVRALLGHRQIDDRWVTPEQMSAEAAELFITQKRYEAWQEEIKEIREMLDSPSRKKHDLGVIKIRELKDASSVPALELILANHSADVSKEVIRKLAQFEEMEASLALMRLSLNSPWFSCRQMATKALGKRDTYHYVPTMLSQLVSPVISQVVVVPGARRQVLYSHIYLQRRMDSDVIKQYDTVYQRITSGRTAGTDSLRQTMRDIRRSVPLNERLKQQENLSIDANNRKVIGVLTSAIGINLGNDVEAWWKWWNDYNEVFTSVRPVDFDRYQRAVEVYDRDLLQTGGTTPIPRNTSGGNCECLVAGTKVWTDRGPLAVEKIRIGDQVLSQNIDTGHLEYKMVLRPTIRPETPTVTIKLPDETIRCSGGHPFWVAGQGWVKARDLKSGLPLTCASGISMIREVVPADSAQLYNLVVEGNANYFVGESKVLSHDNTVPSPTLKRVPGMSN